MHLPKTAAAVRAGQGCRVCGEPQVEHSCRRTEASQGVELATRCAPDDASSLRLSIGGRAASRRVRPPSAGCQRLSRAGA